MRASEHDSRRIAREQQSRMWTGPVMDYTMLPRATAAETNRRATMNSALWTASMTGGTAVTHEVPGHAWHATASRTDARPYHTDPVSWSGTGPGAVPQFDTSFFRAGVDTSFHAREMRGIVTEPRLTTDAANARLNERLHQSVMVPLTQQQQIVQRQLDAAEALRPMMDDFRVSHR